jgi:hypothetical protein
VIPEMLAEKEQDDDPPDIDAHRLLAELGKGEFVSNWKGALTIVETGCYLIKAYI